MYYLRQQTQISGPFTVEQLKSLLHRGRVARSDKISADKQTWMQIAECAEIAQRPAVASPAAASQAQPAADGLEWFYTLGGAEQPAAVSTQAVAAMIAAGTLHGEEMVWRQGFDEWKPLHSVAEFSSILPTNDPGVPSVPGMPGMPGMPMSLDMPPPSAPRAVAAMGADYENFVGKKVAAGVTALLLGPLGIHKFILGLSTGGACMLLLCLLLVPIPFLSIVAFVEGLLYLTKTDEAFYRDYAVAKKQWF